MNRPSFGEGVAVALLGALTISVIHYALIPLAPSQERLVWLCLLLGLGYGLYLLARSPTPAGRIGLLLAWVLATLVSATLFPSLWPLLLVQLGFIWLTRVWCFHRTPVAALLDAGLLVFGTLAGFWALAHSASLLLAVWTWLLTQALFVLIPQPGGKTRREADGKEGFAAAERAAERALQRLAARG